MTPNETEAETDALGSRAQEDLDGTKSPLGKGESETNEEGRLEVVPIPSKKKESGSFSPALLLF